MTNHAETPLDELKALKDELEKDEHHHLFGATMRKTEQLLSPDDQGEIAFGVTQHRGKVVIDFGEKPISWIGMPPEQAIELAQLLIAQAREANRIIGNGARPLTVKL